MITLLLCCVLLVLIFTFTYLIILLRSIGVVGVIIAVVLSGVIITYIIYKLSDMFIA